MSRQEHSSPSSPMGVEYREIANHPGYVVGSDGTVWSRYVRGLPQNGKKQGSWTIGNTWKRLVARPSRSPRPCAKGFYRAVVLSFGDGRKPRAYFTHVLVLEAFVGPRPDGMFACHGNGDPTDNRLENLRWDTWAENVADMERHGNLLRGSRASGAKLDEADIISIRRLRERGLHQSQLSAFFEISLGEIRKILHGERWQHLQQPTDPDEELIDLAAAGEPVDEAVPDDELPL